MAKIQANQRAGSDQRLSAFLPVLVLTFIILNSSCSKPGSSTDPSGNSRGIPVRVAPVILKDVPLALDTFGKAQSKASVTIKARVTQVLESVHFKDGQRVSRGDLMFTLDSRPYEVALTQARAALARNKILAANAQLEVHRDLELLNKKMFSREDYDKAKADSDALVETLKSDQAAIEAARIDVDHCRITSPIDGLAGKVLVHAGNLVTANEVPLVTINQIKPMDVFFSLPQSELDRVRSYQSKGDLEVEATIPDDPDHPMKGTLTFIDNLVDAKNGTIELGATFANPDESLWPGRYVIIHLILTVQQDAMVVPHRAIVNSSMGQTVFVVKGDGTVEQRSVQVARTSGDDTVITAGLRSGERVVTDGQLQLEDGVRVEIESDETKAAASPETEPRDKRSTP
jgi:membrane fusion protein, multidrug efflux system